MAETEAHLLVGVNAPDPKPAYRRRRDECPVLRTGEGGSAVISRYEDVLWALRHPEVFSSDSEAVSIGNERPLIPLQIDPPEHVKYRKLLDPVFSRKRMAILEPQVRRLAAERIEAFADRGVCDFHGELAEPLPSTVFLQLLGLPLERLPYFLELKDGIIRPEASATPVSRETTGRKIYALFEEALDARSAEPGEDLLSWMSEEEVDGRKLTREQILDICYLLLLAGLDTVTASLDCFVAYLAQHPERRRMAIERPEMLDGVIEELLRSETPVVTVLRVLKQDVTLSSVELKAGERVALLLGAADSDERSFDDPERVDFGRRPNRHLAFGGGPHRCLGSHLARMELRAVLEEFHARIPEYELAPGVQLQYSPGIRQVSELPLVWSARA
ncbi:MAG: cytochrome P450 [Proteobacteria bacterium]|nr:cytochrome P450 [Pseudomonadota bacterium]